MPVLKPDALIDERVAALQKAHKEARTPKAELDMSGGIDSAVMAGLLVLAVGRENLTLVHSDISTNPTQTARAQACADALGVPMVVLHLTPWYQDLVILAKTAIIDTYGPETLTTVEARIATDPTILGGARSCLRAPVGRLFNRLMGGGLRHGTGNECEDRVVRFYQKGGDGEVDSNPIAFLSKGEVYQLALALGKRLNAEAAYRPIIEAIPSPDLWGTGDGHSDEAELQRWLGVPYTYSRISLDTGEYTYVGTNERVNRFLDTLAPGLTDLLATVPRDMFFEDILFDSQEPDWVSLVTAAKESGCFDPMSRSEVEALLMAARRAERATRHKMNPSIPTYGSRDMLVAMGILTNRLPIRRSAEVSL